MALTALTRACPICHALNPDPESLVCDRCGRGMAPPHLAWPSYLKWWLLSDLQADSFHPWRASQDVWEYKLRTVLNGCSFTKTNPWGLPISLVTPMGELYPLALERADWWKAAGSPIAQRIIAAPVRTPV